MLKNIDPLSNADLLHTLRVMGHGDVIAVVDRNFPAVSIANGKPVIALDGSTIPQAIEAILSVLPLDTFVDQPVIRMEFVGQDASFLPDIQIEVQSIIDRVESKNLPMGSVERFAFYEQAKAAFGVVITGEARGYGCFLLKKGVIFG